jgi:hypothetical protein
MILPEYLTTFFLAPTPAGGWPERFYIFTAYNPGLIVEEDINALADDKLKKELNNDRSSFFRITGCSPDLKHREPGWGVTGLSLERALELGRQYGQNAIFEISGGFLSVIGCQSGEVSPVDEWEKRILGDTSS